MVKKTSTAKSLQTFWLSRLFHTSQGRLNPRALRAIFLGYPIGVKGYKVWLLDKHKCATSRDVVFNELKFYKDVFTPNGRSCVKIEAEKLPELN